MKAEIKQQGGALACILTLLLCGCAGISPGARQAGESADSNLPALPAGLFDRHQIAQIQTTHVTGDAALAYSASAVSVGSAIRLTAPAGQPSFEWAIWKLTPSAGAIPQAATFALNIDAGDSAWIGVADYGEHIWKLAGPYASSGDRVIGALDASNISPGGNIFLIAGAYSGTQLTVDSIELEIDVPAPPKFFITGTLKDTVQNLGFQGQPITLMPGSIQAFTNNSGVYTFPSLDPQNYTLIPPTIAGYDIAPASIQVDLTSSDKTDAHFLATPQTTDITYTNSIKLLLDAKCVECHGADDAPRKRLDIYISGDSNDAFHNAEDSLARIQNSDMPPTGQPLNASQRQMFDDWINDYGKAE